MTTSKKVSTFHKYTALLWPLLGGIAMVVLTAYVNASNGDDLVTAQESVQIVIQGVSVLIVWLAANLSTWPRVKPLAMATMAVLNLLVTVIDGGVTFLEGMNLAIAFLTAVGVYVTPGPVTGHTWASGGPVRSGPTIYPG